VKLKLQNTFNYLTYLRSEKIFIMTAFNDLQEQNDRESQAINHPQEENHQQSKATNKERKSLFGSKTFWGILFTSTAAIAPIVGNNVDKILDGKQKDVNYGQDAAQIVVIVCGAAASIVGRVEAKSPIYTPKWMPGPSNTDFDSEEIS
jgi:anti-sigma-K factor RskA